MLNSLISCHLVLFPILACAGVIAKRNVTGSPINLNNNGSPVRVALVAHPVPRALKDLTTGLCLSSFAADNQMYASHGSSPSTFLWNGTSLKLDLGDWQPLCVVSESSGTSQQLKCSDDIDYKNGQPMTSSYQFSQRSIGINSVLQWFTPAGAVQNTFYGCGPQSAVYSATTTNSGPAGVCHAAMLALVPVAACTQN